MALSSTGFRKQVVLFLLAVILPCAVLVAVTIRLTRQEQELARRTAAEECGQLAAEIGSRLLARLRHTQSQEIAAHLTQGRTLAARGYLDSTTILIGRVRDGRLILPWDEDARVDGAARSLAQPEFASLIRSAEDEEFLRRDYARAVIQYDRCREAGVDSLQKGFATVRLARVLAKAGRQAEASATYRMILDFPPSLVDDYGIPLALYAVKPVSGDRKNLDAVCGVLEELLQGEYWLSPAALFFIQDALQAVTDRPAANANESQARRLRELARRDQGIVAEALGLQQRFPALGLGQTDSDPQAEDFSVWVFQTQPSWFLSVSHETRGDSYPCLVIDGNLVLDTVAAEFAFPVGQGGEFTWVFDGSGGAESLGPNFRNLGVRFSPEFVSILVQHRSPQRLLYGLLLLLVLSFTVFGGYLVWRDVRRDLRLAEMRSQFVSSVSHELKTPLTAIRMFAETLRMGRPAERNTRQEYLATIVNESERLSRLLNNVLDFSRIEQGMRRYNLQPGALADVIEAAARTMAYPLKQKRLHLQVACAPDLPDIPLDRDALEQAVINLLSNAMKYSEDSGEISLILRRSGEEAVIRVVDRGIGLEPREQERIFEKYYRVQTGRAGRVTGTGLGLALATHIVKAHGGRIEVASEPGSGSTFSIRLPLGEPT